MTPAAVQSRRGSATPTLLVLAALAAGAAGLAAADWQRMRHLALPVLTDPSLASSSVVLPIEPSADAGFTEIARLPGRVSALLETSGAIWAAGFDTGLFRLEQREGRLVPKAVLGVTGRERFVNALAVHDGRVFAATYAGILEIEPDGRIAHRHLPRLASEALLATDTGLLAGTATGLYALRDGRFEPVAVPAPASGQRVTALALAGGRLWLGSTSGVFSVDWPLPATGQAACWHPMVFGEQAARSNVVLALAAWGDGVLAGTDDGGVVEVGLERVRAFETAEPRANEINPGAAALAAGRALFGTQGGGLLMVEGRGDGLALSRPMALSSLRVSAVLATPSAVLLGADDGSIVLVRRGDARDAS